jgi:hypothetical protein
MPEQHPTPSPRVLLDENVDHLLKLHSDSAFEVVTVPELEWVGPGDRDIPPPSR